MTYAELKALASVAPFAPLDPGTGEGRALAAVRHSNALLHHFGLTCWHTEVGTRGKRYFGMCRYRLRTITLSSWYIHSMEIPWESIINTVTHEVAHAILPPSVLHGPLWVDLHRSLGGNGERLGHVESRLLPKTAAQRLGPKWIGKCSCCGRTWGRSKLSQRTRLFSICPKDKAPINWTELR